VTEAQYKRLNHGDRVGLWHVAEPELPKAAISRRGFHWIHSQPKKIARHIQSGPKKCIHSLLINIFGINLNEISISEW